MGNLVRAKFLFSDNVKIISQIVPLERLDDKTTYIKKEVSKTSRLQFLMDSRKVKIKTNLLQSLTKLDGINVVLQWTSDVR